MTTKPRKPRRMREWPDRPTLEELDEICRVPGGAAERSALEELLRLCNAHGFGRIPQMANAIEYIWRNPKSPLGITAGKRGRK